MPYPANDVGPLRDSVKWLRATVDVLGGDTAMRAPSRLPGWTRAHVLTHLARAADSRYRLLAAAAEGTVGRQYASDHERSAEIDAGVSRPAEAIRADLVASLNRLLTAVAEHPQDRWDAEGEWRGAGLGPVWLVVPTMRREIEYHHVDLATGYRPTDWPADFVEAQLDDVADALGRRADCDPVTLVLPQRTLLVGDGGTVSVRGEPADVLAWLTGRSSGERLRTDPTGSLPRVPPLA